MTQHATYVKFFMLAAILAGFLGASVPARADNFNNTPWGFTNQNRASIAALMKTIDEGGSNPGVANAGTIGGGVTNLVCGNGADSSTAEGNSACIILNNSAGSTIGTNQQSEGSQTANNTQNATVNENISGPPAPEGLDDVLEGLTE